MKKKNISIIYVDVQINVLQEFLWLDEGKSINQVDLFPMDHDITITYRYL